MVSVRSKLTQLVWLSIAAAVATIALKTLAWRLTGSVGLLSDAAESVVNLVAASVALVTIRWATRPPDEEHMYGHEKAEYFSAGFEGAMILVAAAGITWFAVGRLLHPEEVTGLDATIHATATLHVHRHSGDARVERIDAVRQPPRRRPGLGTGVVDIDVDPEVITRQTVVISPARIDERPPDRMLHRPLRNRPTPRK
jgi:divalent metal cation (Fe/Co/Zn/Cd) transporter